MAAGKVVIVGAGPCGIACARELVALGHDEIAVTEAADHPGGLAASRVDPAGFTWDRGGHVVFSHYGEFDRLLADVMGDDLLQHERSSYVRIGDTWVPYPLQNNLHHLPSHLVADAVVDLVVAQQARATTNNADGGTHGDPDADFGTWMRSMFGTTLVQVFMGPYNEKVWAHPPAAMSAGWMAERVATVDWQQAVRRVIARHDDVAWGPNNLFAFPSRGGTGEIYQRAAGAAAVKATIRYDTAVTSVDPARRIVTTSTGEQLFYEHLVWTGPLDQLVHSLEPAPCSLRTAAGDLVHNSVTVVGIGYAAPTTDDRSWLYFPGADVPFYRATNFAKYSPANVPDGRVDRYSSWMTEIASSPWRPLCVSDDAGLGRQVDCALRDVGLVPHDAAVASVHIDHVPYGYPVPTLGRDTALRTIQPWLMERGILARGRFGAWKYEIGNMDHAVKMGVDAARFIVSGAPEQAWTL